MSAAAPTASSLAAINPSMTGAAGVNPDIKALADKYQPYNSAVPGVDVYGSASIAANTAYQNALARINQQRQGLLTKYGYSGAIDPNTGTLSNVSVDQHNPYGQLQQMLNSEAGDDYAAADDAQSRGVMGGLAHKAVSQLKYQHGAQSAQLGSDLFSNLNDLQGQQDSSFNDAANSLYQGQLQQAQLAIANRQFNPADMTGVTDLLTKLLAQYGVGGATTTDDGATDKTKTDDNTDTNNPNANSDGTPKTPGMTGAGPYIGTLTPAQAAAMGQNVKTAKTITKKKTGKEGAS